MGLYRVDRRLFNIGDTILPQTDFEDKMDDEKAHEEELINKFRPCHVPHRSNCLFLFCDLSDALLFSHKYGGNIYEVSPGEIFFRGDMNLLDCVYNTFKATEDEPVRIKSIKKYWEEGSHTFRPCYEVLTDKAIVRGLLLGKDKVKILKDELEKCCSIEQTPTFKSLIISNNNQ